MTDSSALAGLKQINADLEELVKQVYQFNEAQPLLELVASGEFSDHYAGFSLALGLALGRLRQAMVYAEEVYDGHASDTG